MTTVVEEVKPNTSTDYDTGLPSSGNDADREAHFRFGFLNESLAAIKLAGQSKTLTEIERGLAKREEIAQKLRWRASDKAHSAARRRAGRNAKRPAYIEEEQYISRFCRGQMQSVATTRYGIKKLIERDPRPSIETVREMLEHWIDRVVEWACCVDANDQIFEVCPPIFHETFNGSAVPV